jgi:hypothetical protein
MYGFDSGNDGPCENHERPKVDEGRDGIGSQSRSAKPRARVRAGRDSRGTFGDPCAHARIVGRYDSIV